MRKLIVGLSVLINLLSIAPSQACQLCDQYKKAVPRGPIPTPSPLVCHHFTMPTVTGGKIALEVWKGDVLVTKTEKRISTREGEFCFAKTTWFSHGNPDKTILCAARTRVTLNGEAEVSQATSVPGKAPEAYACVRGSTGCGGREHVLLTKDEL